MKELAGPKLVCTFTFEGKNYRVVEVGGSIKVSDKWTRRAVVEVSQKADSMGVPIWTVADRESEDNFDALLYAFVDSVKAHVPTEKKP